MLITLFVFGLVGCLFLFDFFFPLQKIDLFSNLDFF